MLKHVLRTDCERKRVRITRRLSVSLVRRGSRLTIDVGSLAKSDIGSPIRRANDDLVLLRRRRGRLPSMSWHGPPPTIPASPRSPKDDLEQLQVFKLTTLFYNFKLLISYYLANLFAVR